MVYRSDVCVRRGGGCSLADGQKGVKRANGELDVAVSCMGQGRVYCAAAGVPWVVWVVGGSAVGSTACGDGGRVAWQGGHWASLIM
jgi:hypothetical protein